MFDTIKDPWMRGFALMVKRVLFLTPDIDILGRNNPRDWSVIENDPFASGELMKARARPKNATRREFNTH